jgi:arylsulfatase A-like enzyme/Flp pilus assembly protein TadD
VTIDTLRADRVGCYGASGAETATLDRLAATGVRFAEARSHVPLTLPSHATILTGVLPPRTGVRGNGLFSLAPKIPTLAEVLGARGYRTGAVVSSVVLDRIAGLDRGFLVYDDNQRVGPKTQFNWLERGASQVVDAAEQVVRGLPAGPLFLWLHFYDPHTPWVPPNPYRDRFAGHGYEGEIAFVDASIAKAIEVVRRRTGDDLVVAVVADHGESLGEHGENQHGYTLHRGVLRVPLILAGPGLPAGRVVDEPVGLVDLAPTLAGLGGALLPGAEGRSLVRYWEKIEAPIAPPGTSLATGLWEETLHPLYDSGWAPLRGLLTADWHFVDAPRPELYDVRQDPADTKDLAATRKPAVEKLRKRLGELAELLGDVGDPSAGASGSDDPAARERLGKLAALGYLSGAGAKPAKGARLDPKDGLPGFLAVEKGGQLIQGGRAKEAKELLLPFVAKDPTNPRLWHQLGKAEAQLGDLEGASRSLRKALALDEKADFIRLAFAELLERTGDLAGAKRELALILAANPRAADATIALSAIFVREKSFDESERVLLEAWRAGVKDPDLFDRLGNHRLRAGRKDEAERWFREALELDEEDGLALLETGRASLRRGEVDDALARFGRCALGNRAFECRMELARGLLVGRRDVEGAKTQIRSARESARDEQQRQEADDRLSQLESAVPTK